MWLYFALTGYILSTGIVIGRSKYKPNRKLFLFLTMGLLAFLAMFRSSTVGNDTYNYVELYNNISMYGNIARLSWRYEYGYLIMNMVLSRFFSNPQTIIFFSSLFIFLVFLDLFINIRKMLG